ncbi:uncharacterized protein ISCGN_016398 [Ixodes scapularis]
MTTSQQTTPLNPFVVELPEKLDFRRPEDWKRWFTRWERYRVISGLKKQDNETQVNTLVYAMGREAEDILASLKLTDAEKQDYGAVTEAFGKHFVPRTNVIYERAKFNSRKQEPHETVDAFVTDLYKAAETCEYGNLKEELIRDRLVVGLIDVKLSERLQLDSELTLETAITKARNSEVVKQQQREIRGGEQATPAVDEVRKNRRKETKLPIQASYQHKNRTEAGHCRWCGGARDHTKVHCPASNKTCNHCGKKGHYASVCLSRKDKHETLARVSERSKGVEEVYLGVTANCCHPGFVKTELASHSSDLHTKFTDILIQYFGKSTEEGAQTTVHLAVSEDVEDVTGRYFADCRPSLAPRWALDPVSAKRLWDASEEMLGLRDQPSSSLPAC